MLSGFDLLRKKRDFNLAKLFSGHITGEGKWAIYQNQISTPDVRMIEELLFAESKTDLRF